MHNGLLYTGGQKMSKSLGNFATMEELLQRFTADELRLFVLSTHFRSQAEYGEDRLQEARAGFQRLREALLRLQEAQRTAGDSTAVVSDAGFELREASARLRQEFGAAMDQDFNTAAALGKVFELVRLANRFVDGAVGGRDRAVLDATLEAVQEMLALLGFFADGLPRPEAEAATVPAEVEDLARRRQAARAGRDWQAADALRREIAARGFVVEDHAGGYRLKRRS